MDEFSLAVGRTFCWHEVYTADVPATIKFYTECLGWEHGEMEMAEGKYHMFKNHGQSICGIFDVAHADGAPPHWAVYTAVDDVDARLAKCQAAGAVVVHGPMDIPTIGRMVLIKDPQGAMIWLYQPEMPG